VLINSQALEFKKIVSSSDWHCIRLQFSWPTEQLACCRPTHTTPSITKLPKLPTHQDVG